MNNIVLKRAEKSDRDSFISAWEEAFARRLHADVYEWIFREPNILYMLIQDGEILAGYCLYPLPCVINETIDTALLCNNVFVNPKHQGKNLFVRIGKLALNEAAFSGEGILAYGIPNRLALSGHKRVGWELYPPIYFLEKVRSANYGGIQSNWTRGEVAEQVRVDVAKCSLESAKGRSFSIIKTEQFFRWRYEQKPNNKYWFGFKYKKNNLVAYCVCKYYEDGKTLHFLDIDGTDLSAISELIEESQGIAEPFTKSNVWESTAHNDVFEKLGYKRSDLESNLIFIDPATLGRFNLGSEINIVLGDNDVF